MIRVKNILVQLFAALLLVMPAAVAAQRGGDAQGYVLGADDSISIVVYGQTEFNVQTRIKPDGSVSVPLIGSVQASGETVVSLAKLMERKLKQGGYLKDPIVNVEVTAYTSRYARVAGKVSQPGLVPLDRTYRALDVLLKTGWVREGGASYIYLRGPDGKETRLDAEALARGAPDANPVVQPGDTLYVPDADLVYIYGAINRPGPLALRAGMTLRQALAAAGGVSASGSEKGVRLYRGGGKDQEVKPDDLLKRDDVLVVKERLF